MAKKTEEKGPSVLVEVMLRIDGSLIENRLVSFELPVLGFAGDDGVSTVQFESKVLVKTMKAALDDLL